MIDSGQSDTWQDSLSNELRVSVAQIQRLSGGDFADAYRARLSDGRQIFVKTHRNPPPGFFTTEARGLSWLAQAVPGHVPRVLGVSDEPAYLALEWIDTSRGAQQDEAALGDVLAKLHRQRGDAYGRPDGRTTGSLAVPNDTCPSWDVFYASRRLEPLAAIAAERGSLDARAVDGLLMLSSRLSTFPIADDSASLLHGDLWAGNRLTDASGCHWLIDPAAHYGHREFDLAMMRLFGGFGDEAFARYQERYPLREGWLERVALHQLAPLVVHAIKFGGHYAHAVRDALRHYL